MTIILNIPVIVQMIKYASVGVVNTIIGLGLIFIAMAVMNMNPYVANAIGYGCALCVSFILNALWTFETPNPDRKNFIVFLCVVVVCYGLQLLILHGLIRTNINAYLAQMMAMVVYIITGFLGHKFITFRKGSS